MVRQRPVVLAFWRVDESGKSQELKMARRFDLLKVHGSPRQIGLQVGEALRDKIPLAIDQIFEHELGYFEAMTVGPVPELPAMTRADVLQKTRAYLPHFQQYAPDMVQELHGIAEGARIDFEEALLLQIRGEIVYALTGGCTSFALGASTTKDHAVVTGQNWDYAVDLDLGIVHLLHVTPDEGPRQLMLTFAGLTSYLGINSSGVSSFCNALPWAWCSVGIPHYPLWWRVFRETGLAGVRSVMEQTKSVQAENHVFSDSSGSIANGELTPEGVAWLPDEEGFFVHTNHYVSQRYRNRPDLPVYLADSPLRLERMRSLIRTKLGVLDVASMETFLSDHQGFPTSICRHEKLPGFWTSASLVAVPQKGLMYVCAGNPCEGEFVEYQV
jgi:isopenicillin-N N-acyltransferase-like protein